MRVRIIRQTDAVVNGVKRALFDGQSYDLPVGTVRELIASGKAESLEAPFRGEPEAKAVEGPPEDKAMRPAQNKGRRG